MSTISNITLVFAFLSASVVHGQTAGDYGPAAPTCTVFPYPPPHENFHIPRRGESKQVVVRISGRFTSADFDGQPLIGDTTLIDLRPNKSTAYIGTVSGPGGSSQCGAVITVEDDPVPPWPVSCRLWPQPIVAEPGRAVRVWLDTFAHVTQASVDGATADARGGWLEAVAEKSREFTAQVSGPAGSSICTARLYVFGSDPCSTSPQFDEIAQKPIIEIRNESEFAAMRDGGNYRLANDIVFSERFEGRQGLNDAILDGNGHSLSNFRYHRSVSPSRIGIFASTSNTLIKNLTVRDSSIRLGSDVNHLGVGILSGVMTGGRYCNVHIESSLIEGGRAGIGGIVGGVSHSDTMDPMIVNSSADVQMLGAGSHVFDGHEIGGLVGGLIGIIKNSWATGHVEGRVSVGGLVGSSSGGAIIDSFATGNISNAQIGGGVQQGGLVGFSSGSITNSFATGRVWTSEPGAHFGGLVGRLGWLLATAYGRPTIDTSFAFGDVRAAGQVGGLAGTANRSTVSRSFALGQVSAGTEAGGLTGMNFGTFVSESFAVGDVWGEEGFTTNRYLGFGGLIGTHYAVDVLPGSYETPRNLSNAIEDAYAYGSVSYPLPLHAATGGLIGMAIFDVSTDRTYSLGRPRGGAVQGGLIGASLLGAVTRNSYWDVQTSGLNESAGGEGRSSARMQEQSNYLGWDFKETWKLPIAGGYPVLASIRSLSQPLYWQNVMSGELRVWHMRSIAPVGESTLTPQVVDPRWKIVGSADFNGDGEADLLWLNGVSGELAVWFMRDTQAIAVLPTDPPAITERTWEIAGTGDFDGDGQVDVLWRNLTTGLNRVWVMDGLRRNAIVFLPEVLDRNWKVVGTGDFNGDGRIDILWQNEKTGGLVVWLMDRLDVRAVVNLDPAYISELNWRVVALRDVNGDGKMDILWRHHANGSNRIWLMDRLRRRAVFFLPPEPDMAWRIVAPR